MYVFDSEFLISSEDTSKTLERSDSSEKSS